MTITNTLFICIFIFAVGWGKHAHNGESCEENSFLLDAHGCPEGVYYDPLLCTGAMLNVVGNVWTKEIKNISIGHDVEVKMVIQEPNSEKGSFEAVYKLEVFGRNNDLEDWETLTNDTVPVIIQCPTNRILCNKETVMHVSNSSYSQLQLQFSFVQCDRTDLINAVFFEFVITNCTHESTNFTNPSSGGFFNTAEMIVYLELGAVALFGFIILASLVFIVYRRIGGSSTSHSFHKIQPTISIDPYRTVQEYSFAPRDTALETVYVQPMDQEQVEVIVNGFPYMPSSPYNSPLVNRRGPVPVTLVRSSSGIANGVSIVRSHSRSDVNPLVRSLSRNDMVNPIVRSASRNEMMNPIVRSASRNDGVSMHRSASRGEMGVPLQRSTSRNSYK